ncbi:hypothetical protein [Agromyces sp. S2-1-8]|uniref:hypothetical protein n=1 Tax=unclassified Agromyces TaxID=2639701 RepID=UPI001E290DB9|nr:hypothetical protein [Agromyces sp. S2-1-8]MCD5345408.1 hypothetical protein [Agromyces sp. S2-1-8]
MNTSSLALGQSQRQATEMRAQARRLNERIALRAGLALIAWSRRQSERLSHDAVMLRQQNTRLAHRVRGGDLQRVALIAPHL